MTDVPVPMAGDPLDDLDLEDLVRVLIRRVTGLGPKLDRATATMRRHRRATWLAVAALLVAGLSFASDTAQDRHASCERGNDVRASVVRAVDVAVHALATGLTQDSPAAEQAAARDLARDVVAEVAGDPDLQPIDC